MKFNPTLTLNELSGILQAEFVGDPDFVITGMNEIHMVEPGDLTFVDHPKYYNKALNSKATTILINKKVDCPNGKALIFHDKPFDAFISLAQRYRPFIASHSAISDTATVGTGTIIQPGAFIGNRVQIGKNCLIHANVSIYDHCVIGDDVVIHANSVIGADAYYFQRRQDGYKKFDSCGRVIIGNKVEIGALCSIDKGVTGDTIIDEGTKMDNHCQVGHDTYIGKNCLIGSHAAIAGVTRIEDDVVLWGRVAVNKDLVIGKGAVVLATSAIDKDISGNKTYFGAPVAEVRRKWREMAAMRQLPEFMQEIRAILNQGKP